MEDREGQSLLREPLLSAEATESVGMAEEIPTSSDQNDAVIGQEQLMMEETETPWYKSPLQLIAMLSNYSTSYNVVNISMVIPILEFTIEGTTSEDAAASASSLLAGMIVGQLLGGYLGDSPVLGRMGALQLVMVLQVIASLGSAMIWSSLSRDAFFVWLAIFRFLLGVGAGGVYPLAAVLSAEQGNSQNATSTEPQQQSPKQVRRVVLTFSTQGLGFITVPLVTVPLLYMTTNLDIVWRVILALGSIPGIIMMAAQLWIHKQNSRHEPIPTTEQEESQPENENCNNDPQDNYNNNPQENQDEEEADPTVQNGLQENNNNNTEESPDADDGALMRDIQIMEEQLRDNTGRWASIQGEPMLFRKLLGTAGTWFLFDVLFYGNALFQPIVIEAAFGSSSKGGDPIIELRETAINSLILTAIALPGYGVAGLVMGRRICGILQTPKYIMLQGFALMAVLYFAIGTNWSALKHTPVLLVLLYGMTFFAANNGPNTTTFILPSMVFSPECRSTLNGVSAAAGKLGALTGATLFEPVAETYGDANVMLICSGIAVLAFVMTWWFVQMHPTSHRHE
ncbi:Inorganic phosphate transporter 1-6 [Seminavis robusta]|uniref:Inorganic phosphate transporter 1-6 n=1 Tax=Seminavis robusta TaxID=568900 RepID=A0A9N8DLE3_9STRA|nr:Inorganic phosphate transporter 1-6 [Seminavis robusta]|eukprot:Sro196_g083360.1 Inorganic phosphate transporter 1-6 (569) ;mRNA; f:6298-8092